VDVAGHPVALLRRGQPLRLQGVVAQLLVGRDKARRVCCSRRSSSVTTAANTTAASVPNPSRSPSHHVMPTCTIGTIRMTTTVYGRGSSSTHWLTSTTRNSVEPAPGSSANTTPASASTAAT